MAELTLLEMTQDILSSLDSDSVNSISDTTESQQVATIIKNKYYDIQARGSLPEQNVLFQLDPSLDATKPVLMLVPTGTSRINWIKYYDSNPANSQQVDQFGAFSHGLNTDIVSTTTWSTSSTTSNSISSGSKTFTVDAGLSITVGQGALASSGTNSMFGTVTSYSSTTLIIDVTSTIGSGTYADWIITNSSAVGVPGYKYVTLLPIDQFLDFINRFNPADTGVESFTFTEGAYSFNFLYRNDKFPQYCTVIENDYVIFDSFDANFDTTLQASKTLLYGYKVSPFSMTDSFVPDLDDNQFPLLLNEAKAMASYEMKQTPHMKAEQEIRRQWSTVQKNKSVVNKPGYFDQIPSFGRVPRTGGYSGGGYGAYKWMRQAGP